MKWLALFLLVTAVALAAPPDRLIINIGNEPNDNTGDSIRSAFMKTEINMSNAWTMHGNLSGIIDPGLALASIYGTGRAMSRADLMSFGASSRTNAVVLLGYNGSGDGGGGVFYWHAAATQADDGGTCFAPPGLAVGRWLRIFSGPLDARWFGAKGDGVTDDTAAIQAAINAAGQSSNAVFLAPATYVCGPLVYVPNMRGLRGVGSSGGKAPPQFGTILRAAPYSSGPLLTVPSGTYGDISNICFDGNKTNQTGVNPLIWVQAVNNYQAGSYTIRNEMKIYGVAILNSNGDGLRNEREELHLDKVFARFCEGNGFTYVNAVDCVVSHSGSGVNKGDGWHFVGNNGNLRWDDGDAWNNRGHGIYIEGPVGDSRFVGVQCNNNWKCSLWLTNVVSRIWFDDFYFASANWTDDSLGNSNPAPSGTYPEVCIADSPYSTGLYFANGNLGYASPDPGGRKPLCALYDCRKTGNLTNGLGVAIQNSVIADGSQFSSGNIFLGYAANTNGAAITTNFLCYLNTAGSSTGGGVLLPSRAGSGQVGIGGPLVMDGFGSILLYQPYPNSFGVAANGHYLTFNGANGLVQLPNDVWMGGKITNFGSRYLFDGSSNNYGHLEYMLPGGGKGLQVGLNSANSRSYSSGTNGVFVSANGFQAFGSDHSPTPSEIGAGGWLVFQSGPNLLMRMVATNGLSYTDTILAPTPSTTRVKLFSSGAPTAAEVGTNNAMLWTSNAVTYVTSSADGATLVTTQIAPPPSGTFTNSPRKATHSP